MTVGDEERTGTCMAGAPDAKGRGGCKAYDPVTQRPAAQWPLCIWCLEVAERDVRALTLDYRDLEQHLPPSLGLRGTGMPQGKGASAPLPLAENVLALQQDIWFLTDAWDDVARDLDRLSDKPTRTRAGWAVQQSVTVLAPRLDRLARVTATMWDYPGATERCSEIPGWQGVLDLSHLHQRARAVLGLTREEPQLLVGVLCRGCDRRSSLTRAAGEDHVVCSKCSEVYSPSEYADWLGLDAAAVIREAEAA